MQETKASPNSASGLTRFTMPKAGTIDVPHDVRHWQRPQGTSNAPAAEPVGHHPHDFDRKERRLLDEDAEPLQIDHGHLTVGACDRGGASRLVIEQRELAEYAPDTDRFEDLAAQDDMHLALRHGVHGIARLAFGEDGLTGLERSKLLLSFQKMERTHRIMQNGFTR